MEHTIATRITGALLIAGLLVACGEDDGSDGAADASGGGAPAAGDAGPSGSTNGVKCHYPAPLHYCVEYTGANWSGLSACDDARATQVDACPVDDLIGKCQRGPGEGGELLTSYYEGYVAGVNQTAEGKCQRDRGVWTPPG